jgi:ankyrin repeat protein
MNGSRANINAKSQDGRTPIQWAKDHGHDGAVQLILESQLRNNGTPGSSERGVFARSCTMFSRKVARAILSARKKRIALLLETRVHARKRVDIIRKVLRTFSRG